MWGAVFPDIINNFGPFNNTNFLSDASIPAIELTYFRAAKVHFFQLQKMKLRSSGSFNKRKASKRQFVPGVIKVGIA